MKNIIDEVVEMKQTDRMIELTSFEVEQVGGGPLPAIYAFYAAGFLSGVYGGWTFGGAWYNHP